MVIKNEEESTVYALNKVVTFKKPHPCGGFDWKIVRLGVDIKVQCLRCGKYVNVTRDELKKRAACVREE